METAATSNSSSTVPPDRVRHVWFPLVVIALAGTWWVRQAAAMGYTTLYHVLVVPGSALLLAIWFVRYGQGQPRTRQRMVWAGLLAIVAWMIVMKPVYNGDMGIHGWKLRFARDA